MNEKKLRSFLQNLAEQKAPAEKINLWPAIAARLSEASFQTGKLTKSKGTTMKSRQQSILRMTVITTLAVVLTGFLFLSVTTQGQAIAQNILHFFARGQTNLMPGTTRSTQTWVDQTPGVPAATPSPYPTPQGPEFESACGSFQNPRCTIEEIRELVTFPIYGLFQLPDRFYLSGATGGSEGVIIVYTSKDHDGYLTIIEGPVSATTDQSAWRVGADADIESIMIGSAEGEYVKGSYDGNHNPPDWNRDLDLQTLRWVDQDVAITMQLGGKKKSIDRDGMVALAESLTNGPLPAQNQPLSETTMPTDEPIDFQVIYPLTLAEAEQKAGFPVQTPSIMPEALSYIGARYDEDANIVFLFYQYISDIPGSTNGLLIQMMDIPDSGVCSLCSFEVGQYDGKVENAGRWVGENATIEVVQVSGSTAQYVEGVWSGTERGWIWDPTSYVKSLRWQSNGIAFELGYFGMEIEIEDMITIANSIR
jgi:hypothetical protein